MIMVFEKYKQRLWQLMLVTLIAFALSLILFRPAQAADYNCGAYGRGAYDSGQVCGAATTDDDGSLVNTGQALAIAVPATMILAGTIMLFRVRRKSRKDNHAEPTQH
jgi:hypothetical protein